ncbi:TNT domain-containing protein [Kitasatospora sp. NPDC058218]|uniref:TNT domain-containing protein n=1 Tax=Kitasatospora sp. NPDC058218 TaxID=3346385 RepID=UPI0036DB8A1A
MRNPALAAFTMAVVLPLTGLAATGTAVAQSSSSQRVPIAECDNVPKVFDAGAEKYLCTRVELGPAVLPTDPVVKRLLVDYDRLGGVTPARFLDWYRDWRGWKYPDHMGFTDNGGDLDMTEQLLQPGKKLDRFGGNARGRFLAPGGTPFPQRALPPDSLNGGDANYHCFEVKKPFKVQQGHIAGAFSQPGNGLQQWLDPDLKPADPDLATFDVAGLLDAGYLTEHVTDKDFCLKNTHGS